MCVLSGVGGFLFRAISYIIIESREINKTYMLNTQTLLNVGFWIVVDDEDRFWINTICHLYGDGLLGKYRSFFVESY